MDNPYEEPIFFTLLSCVCNARSLLIISIITPIFLHNCRISNAILMHPRYTCPTPSGGNEDEWGQE